MMYTCCSACSHAYPAAHHSMAPGPPPPGTGRAWPGADTGCCWRRNWYSGCAPGPFTSSLSCSHTPPAVPP
jgi:hypothetical protein